MVDSQLSAILTSILDILAGLNKRLQADAYYDDLGYDDLGQTDAIAKVRELVAGRPSPTALRP